MELQPNLHLGAPLVKLLSPFSAPAAKEEAFSHLSALLESDPEDEAKSIYDVAKSLGAFEQGNSRRRSDALEAALENAEGGSAIRHLRTQVLSEILQAHVPVFSDRGAASVIPFPPRAPIFS